MNGKGGYQATLRMKQLPKAEYGLAKSLIDKYGLDDMSELFLVSLRTVYEIIHMNEGNGEQIVKNVIGASRSEKGETRVYSV